MALYQATRDAEIAAITPERVFGPTTDAIVFSDEDTALIRRRPSNTCSRSRTSRRCRSRRGTRSSSCSRWRKPALSDPTI
ncbi:hypothetical protein NJ76_22210 [Rhodococcus sp. IITR03]|nr:hypothetical protein NJ76_22210 [Rhodococcus sp. IITR03]